MMIVIGAPGYRDEAFKPSVAHRIDKRDTGLVNSQL